MQERCIFIVLSSLAIICFSDADQELFIGLITGSHVTNSDSTLSGVQDALDIINNGSDLLSGFKLNYISSQIECSRTAAVDGILKMILHSSQKLVALIGSECSTIAEATADITRHFNITQISCASSSEELSDRVRFPYYFQLLPSEVNLARVFYSIIKEYGWRRVALIVQNEHRYKTMITAMKHMLSDSKDSKPIAYVETVIEYENDIVASDRNVFDSQSRIFVIATGSRFARQLMCKAQRLGMKYPKHIYLMYGTYESQWWTIEDENLTDLGLNCSPEERAEVLEFSLAALHISSSSDSAEAECELQSQFYYQYFDAVFAIALALNKTIGELNWNLMLRDAAMEQAGIVNYSNFTIANFNYNVSVVTNLIRKHLQETIFTGKSGPVHFNKNGTREVTDLRVLQYRRNQREKCDGINSPDKTLRLVDVATVLLNEPGLNFSKGNKYEIWPSYTPIDGVPDTKLATINLPVAMVLVMLNASGVVFGIICLVFISFFRNKKLIRLTSPNLNYLMIVGMILVYSSGIAYGSPTANLLGAIVLCFIRIWMLLIGYSFGIGTIVAKLWRVYHIFRNPHKKKNTIQDWHLMLFVFIVVLGTIIFMLLNILLEGIIVKFAITETPNKERPSIFEGELKAQTDLFIYRRSSKPWIGQACQGVPLSIQCLLQIFALYLAYQTRKVKVKGLNDTRNTAMVVYIVTTVCLVSYAAQYSLLDYVTASSVLISLSTWMIATTVLGIMFITKMVRLYRDPDGSTVFTAHETAMRFTTSTVVLNTHHTLSSTFDDEINCLRKRVKELESVIAAYKKVVGIDIKKIQLKSSISMINIHTQDGYQKEKEVKLTK